MILIHKRIVVDERGKPQSVLIPWDEFCELSEALGLDLDRRAKIDLRATRRDWKRRKTTAFKPLSEI
jgi:PHD/YefM family antitoxin component YafN of YafNO toxin-antitoxin module